MKYGKETCAGSYPGAKNFGMSLKRAGSSYVEATGEMAAAGESPKVPKGHKFSPSGSSRKGSTAGGSYSPYAPTAPDAYRGGVGTGQGKNGSQG
jgi:hypothetical protein